jgi:hypothetical protein
MRIKNFYASETTFRGAKSRVDEAADGSGIIRA